MDPTTLPHSTLLCLNDESIINLCATGVIVVHCDRDECLPNLHKSAQYLKNKKCRNKLKLKIGYGNPIRVQVVRNEGYFMAT
jgi:hypothetical protein